MLNQLIAERDRFANFLTAGYIPENYSEGTGSFLSQPKLSIIILGLGLISLNPMFFMGTGSTQLNQYHLPGIEETTISYIKQDLISSLYNTNQTVSDYDQIQQIKRNMGFNILEFAAILRVSRPTVYAWMDEAQELKLRSKKNIKRLAEMYQISKIWEDKKIGQLSSYTHKPIGNDQLSLFDLLTNKTLDLTTITACLDQIAQLIVTKRQKDQAHEALLKKYGFEPLSKEAIGERLKDLDFLS